MNDASEAVRDKFKEEEEQMMKELEEHYFSLLEYKVEVENQLDWMKKELEEYYLLKKSNE